MSAERHRPESEPPEVAGHEVEEFPGGGEQVFSGTAHGVDEAAADMALRSSARPPPLPPRGTAAGVSGRSGARPGRAARPGPAVILGFVVLCALLGMGAGLLWNSFGTSTQEKETNAESGPLEVPGPAVPDIAQPLQAAPIRLGEVVVTEGEEEPAEQEAGEIPAGSNP